MAAGRDIHGRVVMDVTADTDGLRQEVDRKLARAFDLNVDMKLPPRQAMQEALDRRVGKGLKLKVNLDLPSKQVMQKALDAKLGRGLKLKVSIDLDNADFAPVIARTKAAQKTITAIEAKEQAKRDTARENALTRLVESELKGRRNQARQVELLEERTNARLDVLNEQHFNRLNAQTAAAALRREVIEANLNARLTAQNDAFEKRRQFAFEATQRKLQSAASKPILQSVLINANALNRSLGDFDRTVSRVLRTSLLAFTAWSAGVEAAVAGAAAVAVVSFAKVELAATQTASVVAAQQISKEILEQGQAISDFSTIVDEEFDKIVVAADKIALDTLFDTGDIVGSIDAAVKAGLDLDQALKAAGASANFAQVNGLEASEAAEQLAAGLAAAGIEADKSASLIDKISFTAATSLGEAGDFLEAFSNRAAASARAFGFTNDEVLTFLSLLGQTGTVGREAGTQTNIVFRELGRAAGRAAEAWKKYGIEANAPLNEQLVKLAEVVELTRKSKGRAGVAGLAEELGLTYKSISSILQVLPKVDELGLKGLNDLRRGIETSGGLVDQQAEQVRHTIAFQWDNLLNTTAIAARKFAGRVAPALEDLFDVFAGKGGLINDAEASLEKFGDRMAETVKDVTEFVQTDAFKNGVVTIVEAIEVTLVGVSDAFEAFSEAFNDAQPAQSTFEAIADTLLAFAQTSATVLPVVARILGQIFDFMIDNADAFETFAKITVAVFLTRRAFTLLIVPTLAAFDALDKARKALIAYSAAETIGPVKGALVTIATNLGLISTNADKATGSIRKLAGAQAALDLANLGGGVFPTLGRGGKGGRAGTSGADGLIAGGAADLLGAGLGGEASRTARNARNPLGTTGSKSAAAGVNELSGSLRKLNPELEKTSSLLGRFGGIAGKITGITAIVVGVFDLARGAVDGFNERWDELTKDSDATENFRVGLEALGDALGLLGDALGWVSDRVQDVGAEFGAFVAEEIFAFVSAIGGMVNFVKDAIDAIVDGFNAMLRAIGDSIASFIRGLQGIASKMGALPGGGKFREWADELDGAADAADKWGEHVDDAAKKTENALAPIPKWLRNTRDGTWELNEEWLRNQRIMKNAGSGVKTQVKGIADAVLSHIPGATAALKNFNEALRTASANRAADAEFNRVFDTLTAGGRAALTPESQVDVLNRASAAAAVARARVLGLYPAAKQVAAATREAAGALAGAGSGAGNGSGGLGAAADDAATSTTRLTTAAEQAAKAVDNMSGKALQAQAVAVIGKATRAAADGYKATRVEAEILRRVLPSLEKDLEGQRAAVQALDDALRNLQSTQLKGTKAFSDQQFGLDQQSKGLELQRLDLIIGGATEEDPAIKAIDDQLAALRNQAERARLVEALELDPLRRKLEDTFNPVKELSFDQIMGEFQKINEQRAPLIDAITGGEQLKVVLERTIGEAEQRFEGAGKQVSAGLARGIRAGTKQVFEGGKFAGQQALAGLDSTMDFGSPSRVMHQHGVWAAQGLAQGITAATPQAFAAASASGLQTMSGFLEGLKQGFGTPDTIGSVAWYLHVFIPNWIRENKGPVAYDATILVPAGHAVMEGFGKGLRAGFSDVAGFVKDVGPSIGEMISGDAFSARIAPIMADIALGKTPDVDAALADLRPASVSYDLFSGLLDPTLGFLHRSLSYADTKLMAEQLAAMFGLGISSMRFDHSKYTIDGNLSRHGEGLAADFSNGSQPTPEMDALYAALLPLKGKIFDELLYKTMVGGNHFNHVHAAWLAGKGFSIDSGKLGQPAIPNIPGASAQIDQAIAQAAAKYKVELALVAAVAKQESGFRAVAGSPAGAQGLMQLMPATAAGLGVTNLNDPFQNALGGTKYLRNMLELFGGRYDLALAGYNAGPGAVQRYGGIPPFSETRNYVRLVTDYLEDFRKLFGGARELGGPTQAGRAYLVGERGPELHVPSRSGMVIPADQTQRILSGGSAPQYIDNSVTHVTTAATDPDIVAEKIDRKKKKRMTGVNLR